MKDESLLLPNGLIGERNDWTGGPVDLAPPRRAAPPASREEVLARLSAVKKAVYALVRDCVDELEQAAPWELLYYPPEDPEALLAMIGGLIVAIREVPPRIDLLLRDLPAGETGTDEPAREDIGFLFHGIHRMVGHDMKRLEGGLETIRDRASAAAPTLTEVQHLCELAADLKGKYTSSLMGAAANLIGEGMWAGVELEPVLFPEKAEEFRSTRELVLALREAVAAIRQLPEQIRFAELVERWRQKRRVDQYALAELPSLRGKIGRLLQERSRRALYSGDYHQISRREVLLSARINELEQLHQQTWAPVPPGVTADLGPVFSRLEQLALEVAAVLDVDILKQLLGEKKVNGLRGRAGKKPQPGSPAGGEQGLDALIPLLAEDDLRIFFEMLLTAVQRRASLSVQPVAPASPAAPISPTPPTTPPPVARAAPAAVPRRPPPPPPRQPPPPPPRPPAEVEDPVFSGPPAAPARRAADPRAAFARIQVVLADLLSPTNPHGKSFRMTLRLLEKHSRIPVAMFHAIDPFLENVLRRLVPDLKSIVPYKGLSEATVAWLEAVCRELTEGDPEPGDLAGEIPRKLERLIRVLEALRSLAQSPD
jgi:hypothetical protein